MTLTVQSKPDHLKSRGSGPGKNGGYMPSSLGGRPFIVVRQADENQGVHHRLESRMPSLESQLDSQIS